MSVQTKGKPLLLNSWSTKFCSCCLNASVSMLYANFSPFSSRKNIASCHPNFGTSSLCSDVRTTVISSQAALCFSKLFSLSELLAGGGRDKYTVLASIFRSRAYDEDGTNFG